MKTIGPCNGQGTFLRHKALRSSKPGKTWQTHLDPLESFGNPQHRDRMSQSIYQLAAICCSCKHLGHLQQNNMRQLHVLEQVRPMHTSMRTQWLRQPEELHYL